MLSRSSDLVIIIWAFKCQNMFTAQYRVDEAICIRRRAKAEQIDFYALRKEMCRSKEHVQAVTAFLCFFLIRIWSAPLSRFFEKKLVRVTYFGEGPLISRGARLNWNTGSRKCKWWIFHFLLDCRTWRELIPSQHFSRTSSLSRRDDNSFIGKWSTGDDLIKFCVLDGHNVELRVKTQRDTSPFTR